MLGASKVAAATAAAQLVELLVEVRVKRAAYSAGSCRPVALAPFVAKLVRVEAHEKGLDVLQKLVYPRKVDQRLIDGLDNVAHKIF
jgi:hypothetical protein